MSCVGCVVGSEVHSWGAGGRVVMSCVGCVVGSAVVVEGEGDGGGGSGGGTGCLVAGSPPVVPCPLTWATVRPAAPSRVGGRRSGMEGSTWAPQGVGGVEGELAPQGGEGEGGLPPCRPAAEELGEGRLNKGFTGHISSRHFYLKQIKMRGQTGSSRLEEEKEE